MRLAGAVGALVVALMTAGCGSPGSPSEKFAFIDLYTLDDGSTAYCVDSNSGDLLRITDTIERFPTPLNQSQKFLSVQGLAFYRRTALREWLIAQNSSIFTRSLEKHGEWQSVESPEGFVPVDVTAGTDYVVMRDFNSRGAGKRVILVRDKDLRSHTWISKERPIAEGDRIFVKPDGRSWETFDVSDWKAQSVGVPKMFSDDVSSIRAFNERWMVAIRNGLAAVYDRRSMGWQELTALSPQLGRFGLTQDGIWGGSLDHSVVYWTGSSISKYPLPDDCRVLRVLSLGSDAIVVALSESPSKTTYEVFFAQREPQSIRLTKIGSLPDGTDKHYGFTLITNELIAVGWDGSLSRFKVPSSGQGWYNTNLESGLNLIALSLDAGVRREIGSPQTNPWLDQQNWRRMKCSQNRFTAMISKTVVVGLGSVALPFAIAFGSIPPEPQTSHLNSSFSNASSGLTLVGTNNGHSFRLDVAFRSFDLSKHKSKIVDGGIIVDGKFAWGTDGVLMTEMCWEVIAFELKIDGKAITVPRSNWSNLYNLSPYQRIEKTYYWGWQLTSEGNLTLGAIGSDGAGTYSVRWQITPTGSVRRNMGYGLWTLPPRSWRQLSDNSL